MVYIGVGMYQNVKDVKKNQIHLLINPDNKFRFTFSQWLTLLKPETTISITFPNGSIYKSVSKNGLNFTMEWNGFEIKD